MNEIFFSNNGLTSTSANTIANYAKEYYEKLESVLNNIKYYDSYVEIIGNPNKSLVSKSVIPENIEEIIEEISECKSLIAWLREAIKAKEELSHSILSRNEYFEQNNIIVPEYHAEKPITEEEYISTWGVEKRAKYYQLETQCAVLGKFIHLDGSLNKARKDLINKNQNPIHLDSDNIIYSFEPAIAASDVEHEFFNLQKKHRAYQSELNSLKYEIQEAVRISTEEEYHKYQESVDSIMQQRDAVMKQYNDWYRNEMDRISKLKIVIPNSLQGIYNKIQNLGK